MTYETIILEKKDAIATITLNRPDRLNALNITMHHELQEAFRQVNDDEDVRAVVITGAGKAFCAGADIQQTFLAGEEGKTDDAVRTATAELLDPGCLGLAKVAKPVIAAINGAAVGFGCTVTLVCDIRIASEKARLSFAFARVGLSPEFGSSYFLPRLVGLGKACELVLTAKMIDAAEAERIGLVNQVVPPDELMGTAYGVAAAIAGLAPLAVQFSKRLLRDGVDNDLLTQSRYETFVFDYLMGTEDHKEGAMSFLEKRAPVFRGR